MLAKSQKQRIGKRGSSIDIRAFIDELRKCSKPTPVEYDDTVIDDLRAQLDTIAAIQTNFEPHSMAEEDYVVRSGMANLRGTVGIADEKRPANHLFDTGTKECFISTRVASCFPNAKRRSVP